MSTHAIRGVLAAALSLSAAAGCTRTTSDSGAAENDWAYYRGNPHGTLYSRLAQIDTANVSQLQLAWSYDTGEAFGAGWSASDMQSNPLVVGERLYFVSPKGRLICLEGASGKELWTFSPAGEQTVSTRQRLRGLSYWNDGAEERLFLTFRMYLMAVDARSGQLITSFGEQGRVDLRQGLDRDPTTISVSNVTPGAVYKDLLVMGSTGNTPGHIRAFDVRSGKLRWIFHTIPHPGEVGYETWPADAWKTAMGANDWAGMSLDPERGLVFVPLASGGMGDKDFYGGDRAGDNLFANSLVALDANTGKRVWHFQTVRHDIWDRDLPAPPTLITVRRDGRNIDAIAQITKSGLVYILDRATGAPLYPIEEVPALKSDVPGEVTAAAQIRPTRPEPFARQRLTADLLTQRTPEVQKAVAEAFAGLRSRGPYDPPSLQGTILLPGMDGGGEWGGASFDPETGLLYVNANEMAWVLRLKQRPPLVAGASGRAVYLNSCAVCHRDTRAGSPPEFPSLVDVGDRLLPGEIYTVIAGGSGRMPAFGHLGSRQIGALVDYLRTGRDEARAVTGASDGLIAHDTMPYMFDGYNRFLDPDGYPAIAPPWGTLSAIDVNTGEYAWQIPLGEYPELAAAGLTNTGSENYGGAVVTAGGVLFIGATVYDNKFRAFDKKSGKLLWEATLPAAGNATPSTYLAGGRQFVVIPAGGGKNPKARSGGTVVAFALPR